MAGIQLFPRAVTQCLPILVWFEVKHTLGPHYTQQLCGLGLCNKDTVATTESCRRMMRQKFC